MATARIHDYTSGSFTSGSSPAFNGWLTDDNHWGVGSSLTAVSAPKAGSGRNVVGRFVATGVGSAGTQRVLIYATPDISYGDHVFLTASCYGSDAIGVLLCEIHDPYPGTDDGRINNCVAPIAFNLQETYLLNPIDWANSPMHATAQPMNFNPPTYVWCGRQCFGNGTKSGANQPNAEYDRVLGVPLAFWTPNTWFKFIYEVAFYDDATDSSLITGTNPNGYKGLFRIWFDATSDSGAASFPAQGSPQYEYYGPTMKWITGSADGQIKPLTAQSQTYYHEQGSYRGTAAANTWHHAFWNRWLTFADAVADFGGAAAGSPPVISVSPSIAGTATQGQTLTGTDGTATGTPTPTVLSRQWYRCDANGASPVPIASATGTTYALLGADIGSTIKYGVTWTNTSGTISTTSAQTAVIASTGSPSNPVVSSFFSAKTPGSTSLTGVAVVGQNDQGIVVAIGDAHVTQVTGVTATPVGGGTSKTFTLSAPDVNNDSSCASTLYKLVGPGQGTFNVTAAFGSTRTATMAGVVLNNCDATTLIRSVTPGSAYGSSPNVTHTSVSGDLGLEFLTMRHAATMSDPTQGSGQSLVGSIEQAGTDGYFLKTVVSTKASTGTTTASSWTPSPTPTEGWATMGAAVIQGTPLPAPPSFSAPPAASGTARIGQTLTTTNGTTVNTDGATVYTYQWQRDTNGDGLFAAAISGASASTYVLQTADSSCNVRAVVTATTLSGSASGSSNIIGPVAAAFSTSLIDDFNRPAESPLSQSGAWSSPIQFGTDPLQVVNVSGMAGRATGSGLHDSTSWRTTVSQADSDTMVKVIALPLSTEGFGLWARVKNPGNASTMAAYIAAYTVGTGYRVFKVTGGSSFAQLGSTSSSHAHAVGEYMRFSVASDALNLYYGVDNGDGTFTWTNAVSTTGGSAVTGLGSIGIEANGATALLVNYSNAVVSAAPSNSVAPVITGTPTLNQTLTCDLGSWANIPTSFTVQWKAGGTPISGATSQSLTLAVAQIGAAITVTVTATNDIGSASATSSATSAVAGLAPAVSVMPAVTGGLRVGQTLTSDNGTWQFVPTGYTYQWQRDNAGGGVFSNIGSATAATHVNVVADIACMVRCVVTATNATGSTAANSLAVGLIQAAAVANSAPSSALTILGLVQPPSIQMRPRLTTPTRSGRR